MRAGFASVVLALSLAAVPLASAAADTIKVIDFETATGIDGLLGVENPGTPSAKNVGFEGFYWAWNGSGAITPGDPALVGFLLGNKKSNLDFSYVGGTDPQFVYLTLSQRLTDAYITTTDQPFDFLGAVFSSRTPGTLVIVGQEKSANGIGGGTFRDIPGATTQVAFDGITEVVKLETTDFRNIDRLVISLSDTNGKAGPLQWALNDFTYAPVPEPGTWAMFGLGVLGVGFAVRRRKPRIR